MVLKKKAIKNMIVKIYQKNKKCEIFSKAYFLKEKYI